jgi:hypothetical protein
LGINVLDHIIVTPSDKDFTSMRESEPLALSWSLLNETRAAVGPKTTAPNFHGSSRS